MYQDIVNAIKHSMPQDAEVTGFGRGNRTWLFRVTWPEPDSKDNELLTNTVLVRVEHELIEAEDEFLRGGAAYRIQQFLKYHFDHYIPYQEQSSVAGTANEVWYITKDILAQ